MTASKIALDINFSKLDEILNKFNIFEATGMRKQEIKHTKFLGYLLDPNESHGLGTRFLLAFLKNAFSKNTNQELDILNLHLSLAEVCTEKKLSNGKQLDVYIEIPTYSSEKIIIAIENKLEAQAGLEQLISYRNPLIKNAHLDANIYCFFLTLYGEEPNTEGWTGITFGDTVAPILDNILKNNIETISNYLIAILQDYLDLITEDEEPDSIIEDLARNIPTDWIEYIKNPSADDFNAKKLQVLYPRAFDYLKNFQTDPRVRIRNSFIQNSKEWGLDENKFFVESSDRTRLRYSFLSMENGDIFSSKICNNPTKKWLSSKRHLAFEAVLRPNVDNSQLIDGQVKLVLGPTNVEYDKRNELFTAIFPDNKNSNSLYYSSGKLGGKWPSFEKKNKDEVEKWLRDKFIPLGKEYNEAVNNRLNKFFEKM